MSKREKKREEKQFNVDMQACVDEVNPILKKYNLVFVPHVRVAPEGIFPVLGMQRPSQQPEQPKEE